MLPWAAYFKILIALLVIVDPLAAIPPFVVMAGHHTEVERRRIAWVASVAVTTVLAASAVVGESLLCASSASPLHRSRSAGRF